VDELRKKFLEENLTIFTVTWVQSRHEHTIGQTKNNPRAKQRENRRGDTQEVKKVRTKNINSFCPEPERRDRRWWNQVSIMGIDGFFTTTDSRVFYLPNTRESILSTKSRFFLNFLISGWKPIIFRAALILDVPNRGLSKSVYTQTGLVYTQTAVLKRNPAYDHTLGAERKIVALTHLSNLWK
jgi:hypothetical protein